MLAVFQLTFVHDVTSNSKDTSSGNTITKSSSKVNEPTTSSAAAAGSTTAINQLVPIKLQNGGTSTATKSKVSLSTTTRCNLLITERVAIRYIRIHYHKPLTIWTLRAQSDWNFVGLYLLREVDLGLVVGLLLYLGLHYLITILNTL